MFGSLNAESVDCVVQSIEPMDNLTARLTLVDYSPAVYSSDIGAIPDHNSQITKPPTLLLPTITQRPTIATTRIKSDESVLEYISPGVLGVRMLVPWTNLKSLPDDVTHVEAQIMGVAGPGEEAITDDWRSLPLVPVENGSVMFSDVSEGQTYKVRMRYVDKVGRVGRWTSEVSHFVTGKLNPPAKPSNPFLSVRSSGRQAWLDWYDNRELDVAGYEVRISNGGWGVPETPPLFRGDSSQYMIADPQIGETTFFVRAYDTGLRYSTSSASTTITLTKPTPVPGIVSAFSDTSKTSATVRIRWAKPSSQFAVTEYRVTLYKPLQAPIEVTTKTNEWRTDANWIGTAEVSIVAINVFGWESEASAAAIVKLRPLVPGSATKKVSKVKAGENVTFDWENVARTTLPVWGYEVRSTDSGWGGAGALYRGSTSAFTARNLPPGNYAYYVRSFDTDSNYSASSAVYSHDSMPPVPVTSVTATRRSSTLRIVAIATPPADFSHYEFRVGKAKAGATGGADTPSGVTPTGDFWDDPDAVSYISPNRQFVVPLRDFSAAITGSSVYATYRVAARMVDQAGNVSLASALADCIVSKI
jgi:hypothetical protein